MRTLLILLAITTSARAADWPAWRGPTGQGISTDKDLPLDWGGNTNKNVLWKMPLPGTEGTQRQDQNQSSPVVKKGLVFVTTSFWPAGTDQKEYPEHHVVCFRASDGKQLWVVKIAPGPWRLSDLRGGYTVPTPAACRSRRPSIASMPRAKVSCSRINRAARSPRSSAECTARLWHTVQIRLKSTLKLRR